MHQRRKIHAVSWVVLASVCIGMNPTVVRAQCNSDILVGEDSERYYCMSRGKYVGSAAEADAKAYFEAKLKIGALQAAIRNLGFNVDAERFEMYAMVSDAQRKELKQKLLNLLMDSALDGSVGIVNQGKSLNPWNVNNAILKLEAYGMDVEPFVAALRAVARTKNKPEMGRLYGVFIDGVKAAKEGWQTGAEMDKNPDSKLELVLLGTLKTIQSNPDLGAIVTAADFTENYCYLGYLSGQIDDLGHATDVKLRQLPELSKALKHRVDDMQNARSRWRQETGFSDATPSWKP